ncbi:MAG: hypothetical protein ACFCUM_12120 [Bacteroidales bacterium]
MTEFDFIQFIGPLKPFIEDFVKKAGTHFLRRTCRVLIKTNLFEKTSTLFRIRHRFGDYLKILFHSIRYIPTLAKSMQALLLATFTALSRANTPFRK